MAAPLLARVYAPGGRNTRVEAGPGKTIDFYSGYAEIRDPERMPAALGIKDAVVEVENEWKDWLPEWVEKCDYWHPALAEIRVEGVKVWPLEDTVEEADDSDEDLQKTFSDLILPHLDEPAEQPRRRGRPRKIGGWETP